MPASNAVLVSNALDYSDAGENQSDDNSEDRIRDLYDSNDEGTISPVSEKDRKKSCVRSPESEQVADLFSLVSKRGLSSAPQTISAGRWISFQHKVSQPNFLILPCWTLWSHTFSFSSSK